VTLDEFEKEAAAWFLREALERNKWNVAATAREVGKNRTWLYKILSQLGVHRPTEAVAQKMTPEFMKFLGRR
jgi:DNA-binding NtrC family response regulator